MTRAEFDELKIGDVIRVWQEKDDNCPSGGVTHNMEMAMTIVGKKDNEIFFIIPGETNVHTHSFNATRSSQNPIFPSPPKVNAIRNLMSFISNDNQTIMSKAIDFFRNMTASAEERLLKELGIENPIGTPTDEGLKLVLEILYQDNRQKVIDIAKKLKDDEDAKLKKASA